ncbi:hypothetical protein [Endozoicomonas sp. ALB115]|uniref:hypothetical protein n=1 Tax=Endozoicomonas sp. ALB115 TaxID=3403074 RepID=UPI003BB6C00C
MSLLNKLKENGVMPSSTTKKVYLKVPRNVEDEDGNKHLELVKTEMWFEILPPTSGVAISQSTIAMTMKQSIISKLKEAMDESGYVCFKG